MADQASESLPKAVRGEPLETDAGAEVPAQQPVGKDNVEGGGEWPDPDAPPRAPAPGAVETSDDGRAGPQSADPRVSRLLDRAVALAEEGAPDADAATELLSAAGGDRDLLRTAEQRCRDGADGNAEETRRAAAYLAAARSV